jgi:hypothetical protein
MHRGIYLMALLPHEVFQKVREAKSKNEKISILKENETWGLKDIIRGSMDSTVKWNLPAGAPPYTPSPAQSHPTSIQRENTKFTYFVKGGKGDSLPAFKRENIFIGVLEGIHPEDAELVIAMINKETPKGLTRPIIKAAFPDLLKD